MNKEIISIEIILTAYHGPYILYGSDLAQLFGLLRWIGLLGIVQGPAVGF